MKYYSSTTDYNCGIDQSICTPTQCTSASWTARLKSINNGSSDSHRSSRLHFERKASGLTDVSFWTAPKPSELEDQVRSNFGWAPPGPIESE